MHFRLKVRNVILRRAILAGRLPAPYGSAYSLARTGVNNGRISIIRSDRCVTPPLEGGIQSAMRQSLPSSATLVFVEPRPRCPTERCLTLTRTTEDPVPDPERLSHLSAPATCDVRTESRRQPRHDHHLEQYLRVRKETSVLFLSQTSP